MAHSIGIVECDCLTDVIKAADRMAKSGDVRLVRQVQIGNSKVALVIDGDTHEVELALDAARKGAATGMTIDLVPNVRPQVLSIFDLPGGGFFNVNRS